MSSTGMYYELIRQMNILADEVAGCFSDNTIESFRDSVEAGEPVIALGMLIEILCEYDIVISKLAYSILEKECAGYLDEHYAGIILDIKHD